MKKNLFVVLPMLTLLLLHTASQAQSGSGSMTVDNSSVYIAAGTTEMRFSEGSYFGPNANWVIDGTLEVWSKNVWFAPTAIFSGNGKIVIHNPGTNPFYPQMDSGPTNIDGNNGIFISLLLQHQNDQGLRLRDINDPGFNTANPGGESSAALNIAGTIDLGVDQANIVLNGNNLSFNTTGKITNYGERRMVSTSNSISGHVIKEYASGSSFVFPVGISEGDYTPATLTPHAPGTVYVSVQNYNASYLTGLNAQQGMDRSWHIYSAVPLKADMTLQHNSGTNGRLFTDGIAEISQYAGGIKWDYLKTVNPSSGVHTSNSVDLVSSPLENGVWLTKYAAGALFVPNVFTPNGDGNNDTFEIRGLNAFAENDIVIINRWGNEVYHRINYKNDWTGEGLNEGTYFYILRVKQSSGDDWKIYKGNLLLVRSFTKQ